LKNTKIFLEKNVSAKNISRSRNKEKCTKKIVPIKKFEQEKKCSSKNISYFGDNKNVSNEKK